MDNFEAADAKVEALSNPQQESAAPTEQPAQTQAQSIQDMIDLDKLEKFRLGGKEYTRKDLEKERLMQSDYTRKTQELAKERESFGESSKFYKNLPHDLVKIAQNPSLISEFKRIYPEEYHEYLSLVAPKTTETQTQNVQSQIDPAFVGRLEQIENQLQEKEVEAITQNIDATFAKFKAKYPLADEETLITRAENLLNAKQVEIDGKGRITEAGWESVFKSVQERNQKMAEGHYKKMIEEQKTASAKAKDMASGGGAPGMAPKKVLLKDAEKNWLADLAGR